MIRTSQPSILVLFLLAAACGGSTAGGGGSGGAGGCESNGQAYQLGDTFADDCRTCECTANGIACSDQPCVKACSYGGQHYPPGQSFAAGDGCNTCKCEHDGTVGCTLMACVATCSYGGTSYGAGQSFPAADGCNICGCQADGSVICTQQDCAVSCVYAGKSYAPGDTFPSLDGCNKCGCDPEGNVSCTELACPCEPAAEWWREYVGNSPAECATIKYACPGNATPFASACGCGCEQSPECPQYFDCMPPATCNEDELKKKCPYSGIAY
jgi:hypothetical protein